MSKFLNKKLILTVGLMVIGLFAIGANAQASNRYCVRGTGN